jgi:hypothetical protein
MSVDTSCASVKQISDVWLALPVLRIGGCFGRGEADPVELAALRGQGVTGGGPFRQVGRRRESPLADSADTAGRA